MVGLAKVAVAEGQPWASLFAREGIVVGSDRRDPLLNGHLWKVGEAVGGDGLG